MLALPATEFVTKSIIDIAQGNHDEDSISITEAALMIGGSAILGYYGGCYGARNVTVMLEKGTQMLGTFALARTAFKNVYHDRHVLAGIHL